MKITGISEQVILDFANGENIQSTVTQTEMMDLIDLVGLLVIGVPSTDENERVSAITQALNNELGIPVETISLFSNLECEDIEEFMKEMILCPLRKDTTLQSQSFLLACSVIKSSR
ncbi:MULTISPECIES: HTH domain-containing protein [Peribacillus]|uniref:HTH domain-containing protein n=1 Tax=Peribacillus TaxID=2675229 RepID=UPI00351F316D